MILQDQIEHLMREHRAYERFRRGFLARLLPAWLRQRVYLYTRKG